MSTRRTGGGPASQSVLYAERLVGYAEPFRLGTWLWIACLGILGGFVVALAGRFMDTHSPVRIAIASAVIVVLTIVFVCLVRLRSRDWFHPFSFPLAYVSLTLLLPVLFLTVIQKPIGSIAPKQVTPNLVFLFLLVIGGMTLGTSLGVTMTQADRPTETPKSQWRGILTGARWMVGVGIVWRLIQLPTVLHLPYGYGSVIYTARSALLTIVNGTFFIAVVLTVLANSKRGRSILEKRDLMLVGMFASLTLISGSRGSLVAPALFILWAYHTYQRKIALWQGLLVAAVIVTIFASIGIYRTRGEIKLEKERLATPALSPISTPVLISSLLLERVPSHYPFEHGATYVAAIQRQLPGPLSRLVFGPPKDTGTFVFRRIVNFNNVNAGFAFSFPSEAYLNFGLIGAFAAGLILGCLVGYAYRRYEPGADRPRHLLYPVVLSCLPLGLRSDAVFQIKSVLYTMIALVIAYRFAERRLPNGASPPSTVQRGAAKRDEGGSAGHGREPGENRPLVVLPDSPRQSVELRQRRSDSPEPIEQRLLSARERG